MIIHQAAFQSDKPWLKGNLHTHTTRSDGQSSPETVIRQYAQMGFDFLALTDHRFYNYRNFAPDTGLMILPGTELDASLPGPGNHEIHIVSLGPEESAGNGFTQDQRFDSLPGILEAEEAAPLLEMIAGAGNLPVFCHPEWSGNSAQEIMALKDIPVMEIWNTGCVLENGLDKNAAYWDEVLASGRKIYGAATDDGHYLYQNGMGFVMVRAERDPSSILKALREGAFYSSCGPVIHDFYLENDRAVVRCSPAEAIRFRHFRVPYVEQRGPGITAHQTVPVRNTNYIRAEVTDAQGKTAWTNPIFLDEEYWKTVGRA